MNDAATANSTTARESHGDRSATDNRSASGNDGRSAEPFVQTMQKPTMNNSLEPTERVFDDSDEPPYLARRLTAEERELMDHILDTNRNTTLDDRPQCDYRYKGVDDCGDVEWMHCTNAAKLRLLTTRDDDSYWAPVCYACYPHEDRMEELNASLTALPIS